MADRADWDAATRVQRHLAVAADAELRRRHPDQHFSPLRSAEPDPATESQRAELTLTAGKPAGEMGQWITDLAAHRTFAERLADRQSLTIPSQDPDHRDLGQAFSPWPGRDRDASCSRPNRRSGHPHWYSNAPRTATPTGRSQTDSGPGAPWTREGGISRWGPQGDVGAPAVHGDDLAAVAQQREPIRRV